MKILLTILCFILSFFAFGQKKADKELSQFLKKHRLDTFVLVKIGCKTCEISYEDSLKTPDNMTIILVYKKDSKINLMTFSDTEVSRQFYNLKTDIFNFIASKKQILKEADNYYKEQKLAKFQAPCLVTFPYEKLQIQIGTFHHKHILVDRQMDDCGTSLENKEWFKIELQILNLVDLEMHKFKKSSVQQGFGVMSAD